MSKTRPQTPLLIFSIIAVIAIIAVIFLINRLTSKENKPLVEVTQSDASSPHNNGADQNSLDVDDKNIDEITTGYTRSPEQLVGHIREIVIRANETGDIQPLINLISNRNLSPAQVKRLQHLATSSRLKLNEDHPFSAVKGEKNHWTLNLANKESILLGLKKEKDGTWAVAKITLPEPTEDKNESVAKANDNPTKDAPRPKSNTTEAEATVQQFMAAIIKLDPIAAGAHIDHNTVSYATLAGLCIIVEEAHYLPVKEKAVRNMFLSNNAAGWIVRIESPDTEKTAMFALSTKRKNPQSPWKITEVNLDKLLTDYASHLSVGDLHYIPLIKNPQGGDSIVLYFKLDSDDLSNRTQRQLNIIANLLKSSPDKKLTISGHTDASGSDGYNLNLSNQRAKQTMAFLIKQGVTAEQINITSFGKSKPRQTNTTDQGRRANRRAEILLDF